MSENAVRDILRINHVSVSFDGFYALTDVDVNIKEHEIHFFIGPNGAGKSTLLDIICGKTKPTQGTVNFYPRAGGQLCLTSMKDYQIVRAGVGRKFQTPSVFKNLTVRDNMILSLKEHKGVLDSFFFRLNGEESDLIDQTLEMVGVADLKDERAGELAHGQKQWLEIGMQLVSKPEVIMLDEPAAGMGKPETFHTGDILKAVKKDCTIIVIEHDMDFVRQIADVVTVLHGGKVLMEGDVEEVLADPTVQAVYLGRGELKVS